MSNALNTDMSTGVTAELAELAETAAPPRGSSMPEVLPIGTEGAAVLRGAGNRPSPLVAHRRRREVTIAEAAHAIESITASTAGHRLPRQASLRRPSYRRRRDAEATQSPTIPSEDGFEIGAAAEAGREAQSSRAKTTTKRQREVSGKGASRRADTRLRRKGRVLSSGGSGATTRCTLRHDETPRGMS
jgi:hypothetical protein